jgi:hypothetical protein
VPYVDFQTRWKRVFVESLLTVYLKEKLNYLIPPKNTEMKKKKIEENEVVVNNKKVEDSEVEEILLKKLCIGDALVHLFHLFLPESIEFENLVV